MSLNFKGKNNLQKSKSEIDISSSKVNLNDLFNGKGYIINDKLDKDYINHCIKLSSESKFQRSKETERNKLFKRCKICRDIKNNEKLIFCSVCNDAFHYKCLDPEEKKSETEKSLRQYYECKRCIKSEEEKSKILKYKQLKLEDTLFKKNNCQIFSNNNNRDNISNGMNNKNICYKCKRPIKDKSHSSTCEKCKNNFHTETCFVNNQNSKKKSKIEHKILCQNCENIIEKEMHTTKISDFFKSKKYIGYKRNLDGKNKKENNEFLSSNNNKNNIDNNFETQKGENNEYNSDLNNLNSETKREIQIYVNINRAIKEKQIPEICNVPIRLPKKMSKQMEEKSLRSLFRGLEVKGIEFNDDLVFIDKDCPKELNNSLLESSIQQLNEQNKKKYYKFKEKSRKGIYAPVEVVDDPEQRFIVKALDEMVTNTLICEYTGEVSLARNRLFDENDSIMDLIHSPTSDTSLVICPEKYGNLARFISGINNKYKILKKKNYQNVYSIRVNIDGSVHILLLASKRIKKGEILYYDYNAGGYNTYNTEHFV